MSNLVDKFVDIALGEVGYKEGWNNDTKYGEWYGLNHQPYCDMFVSWCADQTGQECRDAVGCFAYCPSHVAWFKNRGQWHSRSSGYTPCKGDVIFFTNGGGDADHVGIVVAYDGAVYTVEGNTSSSGYNDNGQGVYRKSYSRSSSYILGYGHWQDSVSDDDTDNSGEEIFDMVRKYQNGSTPEQVYSCTNMETKTGELNPWESCDCVGYVNGMYLVVYDHDGDYGRKTGFVEYDGGVVF